MAPESMELKFFDEYTDVWSFGILVWEIISKGQLPYRGKQCQHKVQFLNLIKSGLELSEIEGADPVLEKVIKDCRMLNKWERPNFRQLNEKFKKLVKPEDLENDFQPG